MTTLVNDGAASIIGNKVKPLNLTVGAQQGSMLDPQNWNSNAGYVPQNILPVLITAPLAMRYLPDAAYRISALKSLMETMAHSITGLNSTLNVEHSEQILGHSGEQFQTLSNVTVERSIPVYRWYEKKGKAIQRYWDQYTRLLMADPHTNVPGITAQEEYIRAGSPQLLPEHTTFTMLYIEPDETMTQVINVWMIANMQPTGAGVENVGSMEKNVARDVPEAELTFTGHQVYGNEVERLAKEYLDGINLQNIDPTRLKPFYDAISPDVETAKTGWRDKVDTVVESI